MIIILRKLVRGWASGGRWRCTRTTGKRIMCLTSQGILVRCWEGWRIWGVMMRGRWFGPGGCSCDVALTINLLIYSTYTCHTTIYYTSTILTYINIKSGLSFIWNALAYTNRRSLWYLWIFLIQLLILIIAIQTILIYQMRYTWFKHSLLHS